MKNISLFTIVLITLLAFALPSSAYMASIKTENVKLYESPTLDATVVFELSAYYPVRVSKVEGDWSKISDDSHLTGWVMNEDLSKDRTLMVRRFRINLRATPSKRAAVVDKLYKDQVVALLEIKGSWCRVRLVDPPDGPQGWVSKSLLWGW